VYVQAKIASVQLGDEMVNAEITARLRVQAEGIKEATQDTKDLNKELNAAQRAMAATKPTGANRARAAAMAGSTGVAENIDYNRMRGIGQVTGAASRDFADQSRGLGGLVRLYATFAANIFAVSAAFNALKNAADTANLIKGLDQLGARSGMALGTLAKQFSEATDGVVSLREAAEVTAKATASGLSNKQVLEIAKVAKSASQALGVDALDAVNRLTRGITKLEPELLDEIGIFTKIDPAVQEYARSLNKTAGALTDFERRQAFAVAALKEGTEKFSAIELDANPYSKLLASTKDVAFQVLDLVNRALGPLLKALSESPTALLGVLAAIGTVLLKQAIPALGEFRAGLMKQADDAAEKAKQKAAEAQAAAQAASAARRALAEQEVEHLLNKQYQAEDAYKKASKAKLDTSKSASALLKDDITQVSDAEIAAARKEAASRGKNVKLTKDQRKELLELANTTEAARNAQLEIIKANKLDEEQLARRSKGYGTLAQNVKIAERAQTESSIRSIKANAAQIGSLSGVTDGVSAGFKKIEETGLKGTDKLRAGFGVLTGAIGGALSTALSFASGFLGFIGIVSAVIGIIDSFADKSKEALNGFSKAAEDSDRATKNLRDTFEAIFKNDAYSVDAIVARSNAFNEQARTMEDLAKAADKAKKALSGDTWGSIKNWVADLFGGGVQKSFEKTLTQQLIDAVENIDDSGAKEKLTKAITGELNIATADFNSVSAAIRGLDPASETVRKLNAAVKQTAVDAAEAANKAKEFSEGFKKGSQLYADLKTQFADKSPITQWAIQATTSLGDLSQNIDGPIQDSIANLTTLLTGLSKNPIFGPQAGEQLLKFSDAMRTARDESKQAAKELDSVNRKLKDIEEKAQASRDAFEATDMTGGSGASWFDTKEYQDFEKQISKLREEAGSLSAKQQKAFAEAESIRAKVAGALSDGVKFSSGIIAKTISAQIQKGSTEFLQQYYAAFDTVPQFAAKVIDLKIQEIAVQQEVLKMQRDLITSQEKLAAVYQKTSAEEKVRTLLQQGEGPNPDSATGTEEFQKANREVQAYTDYLDKLEGVIKNPIKALRDMSNETGQLTTEQIKQRTQLQQTAVSMAGINSQLAQQGRQIRNLQEVEKPLAVLRAETKAKQEQNDIERQRNDLLRQRLQLAESGLDEIGRAELGQQNLKLANEAAGLDAQRERNQLFSEYEEKLIYARNLSSEADRATAEASARKLFYDKLGLINSKEDLKIKQNVADAIRKTTASELQVLNQRFEIENNARERSRAAQEATLAIDKARLDASITLNTYTDTYIAQLQYANQIRDAESKDQLARIQVEADYRKRIEEITIRENENKRLATAGIINATEAKLAEDRYTRERELAASARTTSIAGLDQEIVKSKVLSEITLQTALHQAKFNEELDKSTRFADALSGAFGEVGKKLGDLTSALVQYGQTQEKNAKTAADLEKKLLAARIGGDDQEQADVEAEIAKQKKKSRDDELAGNAKVLASSKNLFKQHTVAYKTLAGLEKAMHVLRMVNAGIEMAMTLKKLATQVTASISAEAAATAATATGVAARAPLNITDIFGKSVGQLGPIAGPAVAAALVAMIYGALSGGGGKGRSTFVPNADQAQETQGTAMGYDNTGKKVQVRRGVFGDETAKSESISRSLEVIKENSVDGLSFDNKILSTLKSIDNGINNSAKSLVRISGLRSGSMFGNIEGTQSGGGLFGTGLFASKTSTEIQNSGLIIKGSFNELASTTNKTALDFFEELKITKKKWYGSTKTSIRTDQKEVTDQVSNFFQDIFNNAGKLIKQIATDTKTLSVNQIDEILRDFKIDQAVSFRGLSGEELQKEVESVISSILDDVTLAVFGQFEEYAKFGEGMLETVIRVTDTNAKIAQQVKNLSIGAPDLKGAYAITEALAEAAGGLDEFIEKTEFFRDTFLTEAERLAPIRSAVGEQLKQLANDYSISSIATIKSRDDFKLLVQALDITDPKLRELYVKLLDLAPAFAEVTEEVDGTINALLSDLKLEISDFENNTTDLQKSIRDIIKTGDDYIKQLKEAGMATQENVEIVTKWGKMSVLSRIDQDIRKLYETRRNEINSTIESLKTAKTRLLDLKNALLQGVQSVLTPQEKYANLVEQYTSTLEQAKAGDKTALERFPQISQSLLDSGREMFSSSQVYTDLFTKVMGDISGLDLSLDQQLSDAQKQLLELESQTTFLTNIDESTKTTAEKLSQLITLRETYAALSPATLAGEVIAQIIASDALAKAAVSSKSASIAAEINASKNPPAALPATNDTSGNTPGSTTGTPTGPTIPTTPTVTTTPTDTKVVEAVVTSNNKVVDAVNNLTVATVETNALNSREIVAAVSDGVSRELYVGKLDRFTNNSLIER
jgi:hypothetical protein